MQLVSVVLRVQSPDKLARFYQERLGMSTYAEGDALILGYEGEDALIELRQAADGEVYRHTPTDRYWKIGITLPNVDLAQAKLAKSGVAVSKPKQFNDIGYMCHLADPEGFSIELLQHRFSGRRDAAAGDPGLPLGGGARLGQITLRVADIDRALDVYQDQLGMRLLSIQPVTAYGFTLYFLAFTDERPPNANLRSVENREWLWQRTYTTLELQHFEEEIPNLPGFPRDNEAGFAGITIRSHNHPEGILRDETGGRVYLLT